MLQFNSRILADSINEGSRLTTMELSYPRIIHSEFMTHRLFSRNAASSRAIPIKRMISDVLESPFVPVAWGTNKKGMQAGEDLEGADAATAKATWMEARDAAVQYCRGLDDLKVHKQLANRLLENWMWITVIASGIEPAWANFFKLRCDPAAEPHIQKIAYEARDEYVLSPPLELGEWDVHLPLIGFPGDDSLNIEDKMKVSVGRCARVSYLNHAGEPDTAGDIKLHNFLKKSGHWSPFEHVASACPMDKEKKNKYGGNFGENWLQYRKTFKNECAKTVKGTL